jgi:hypothetical protein
VVPTMMTLRHLPIPFRALFSSFLVLVGIGYLAALLLLFLTDIEPHVGTQQSVVQDIAEHYHGLPSNTRLEMALKGAMAGMASAEDKNRIIGWIHSGATAQGFSAVAPIFKTNCVTCHNPESNRSIPNLTSYDEIKNVVKTDTGENILELARVSHIHLFGTGLIFMITGVIFALSGTPVWFRAVVVTVPYLTIIVDISSWWLTRYLSPAFAYTVLVGGGAMGVALAVQIFLPLWEMWIDPLKSAFGAVARGFGSGDPKSV